MTRSASDCGSRAARDKTGAVAKIELQGDRDAVMHQCRLPFCGDGMYYGSPSVANAALTTKATAQGRLSSRP